MTRLSLLAFAAVAALSAAGAPAVRAQQAPAAAASPADAYPLPAADTRPLQYGRFTVEVVGHGPDVILIPGLNSSRDTWKGLVAAGKSHYRFHLIQVAGFAGTPAGDNASGEVFSPVVEALAQYIHDRRLKAPAVIGHSMGGELALALAARHPDAVSKVMVVDSLPWFGALFGQPEINDRLRGMTKSIVAQMGASSGEAWKQGSIQNTAPLLGDGPMKPVVIGWSLGSDRRVSSQAFGDLVLTDLRPELAAIKVPVTILYAHGPQFGAQTPEQTDAFIGRLYGNLKGVKLIRIMPSHHFIMFDQPARLQSEVDGFLK
jgi:pimeloyl-[acyl-carrier protein] methyl ester esterase